MKIPPHLMKWTAVALLAAVVAAGWWQRSRWLPPARAWLVTQLGGIAAGGNAEADDHAAHDESEDDEGDATSLVLSAQGRRNIGLTDDTLQPVALRDFTRMLTVPAIVVERPGQTHFKVVAPLTGVVTLVNAVRGEAVEPQRLMFRIRLTHEDLVQAQTSYLRTLGALDVEEREIRRLAGLVSQGIVPGKRELERKYEQQRLEATLRAGREALRLHGLTETQVAHITKKRRLISSLDVRAPAPHVPGQTDAEDTAETDGATADGADSTADKPRTPPATPSLADSTATTRDQIPLLVQSVEVSRGEFVDAGQLLAVLADFSELFIEGRAFERDAQHLAEAARNGWSVQAIPESGTQQEAIGGLSISYLGSSVDTESRAFPFYVNLPNSLITGSNADTAATQPSSSPRYLSWQFKPGQRMQLRIPVEHWKDRIVLPVEAVAEEGAESFVFQQNGKRFERREVHVEYRDQYSVVIASDGSLFPGDVIATTGAHQLQMALKNKSGGGVDPHAGHTH